MQILKTIVTPKDTLLSFQKEVTNSLIYDVFNNTCTHFNKPSTLTFSNDNSIQYSYTADGEKLQERILENNVLKKTDYVGNAVYKNDSLQYISTAVGRTVYQNQKFKEEYFVKDHLGNIRSIVDVELLNIQTYLADFEIASAWLENLFFDDVDNFRDEKPESYDPEDSKAARLNGAEPDRRIGTSLILKVMAGDQVEMDVDNYYSDYEKNEDDPISAESLAESLISTLVGGKGGFVGSESHNVRLVDQLLGGENFSQMADWLDNLTENEQPKAYLNYVLFDENMRPIREMAGAFQADGHGSWSTIGTNGDAMTIPVNGYLLVFLSNMTAIECINCENGIDGPGNVFFDKLVIQFKKGRLKQETHYYPFGLPITGLGSEDFNLMPNRQRYQGNEWMTESGLNWMSFGARQYDPQLGRFLGVDPLASIGGQERLSPFHAMGNNPVSLVDPNGLRSGMPETFQQVNGGGVSEAWGDFGETAHSAMGRLMGGNYSDFYGFSGGGGGAYYTNITNNYFGAIAIALIGNYLRSYYIGGTSNGGGGGYVDDEQYGLNSGIGSLNEPVKLEVTIYNIGGLSGSNLEGDLQQNGVERSGLDNANIIMGAAGTSLGLQSEMMDYAVRTSFKSARTYSQFNSLRPTQQARRQMAILGKEGQMVSGALKYAGKGLGVLGVGGTFADAAQKGQWQNHHTADVLIGIGTTFFNSGPWGWAAAGAYFLTDAIIKAQTGKSITEHVFD